MAPKVSPFCTVYSLSLIHILPVAQQAQPALLDIVKFQLFVPVQKTAGVGAVVDTLLDLDGKFWIAPLLIGL